MATRIYERTATHRMRMSAIQRGHPVSVKQRTKISAAMRGNQNRLTHGHARNSQESLTYRIWQSMLMRCNNPNNPNYSYYGGRGIKVDKRWQSFENFLKDMGEKPAGLTLDRTDNDGDYEPGNCRWATWSEQRHNRQRAA